MIMEEIIDLCKEDNETQFRSLFSGGMSIDAAMPRKPLMATEILRDSPPICCIAAFYGSAKCLRFLVANGCDMKKCDRKQRSIVHFASAGGSLEIIELLSGLELDWSATDGSKNTCVHFAVMFHCHAALFWLWCTHNLNLSTENARKITPLHLATLSEDVKMIEFLCKNGCNVNCKNDRGLTPLHLAASKPNMSVVSALCQWGADSSLADNTGLLAYQYASHSGFQHILGFLLSC